jgi:hypothetical protein
VQLPLKQWHVHLASQGQDAKVVMQRSILSPSNPSAHKDVRLEGSARVLL